MDKPENSIQTPNEVKSSEHLTESEIAYIRKMNQFQNKVKNHSEWCMFQRLPNKPKSINKPLALTEDGKVIEVLGKEAPIKSGNIKKGSLRNKKCSCGSGKKYKKCCLLKKTN